MGCVFFSHSLNLWWALHMKSDQYPDNMVCTGIVLLTYKHYNTPLPGSINEQTVLQWNDSKDLVAIPTPFYLKKSDFKSSSTAFSFFINFVLHILLFLDFTGGLYPFFPPSSPSRNNFLYVFVYYTSFLPETWTTKKVHCTQLQQWSAGRPALNTRNHLEIFHCVVRGFPMMSTYPYHPRMVDSPTFSWFLW